MSSIRSKLINSVNKHKVQILWVIVIILFCYLIFFTFRKLTLPSHGFASYYTASRLLLEGESVADFYNDDWFSSKVEKYVPGVYEIYLVNSPVTAFILFPIAGLDYQTARASWLVFHLIFFTAIVYHLIKRLELAKHWLPLFLIILLIFQPLHANIAYAQVYILITSLLMLAWFAYQSGNEKILGAIIGFIIIFKTVGVLLLLLFAIQKKWEALYWTVISIAILFAVSLPFVGFDSWIAYIQKALEYTSSPTLSVTAYQSIHSFFHHFFFFDEKWNPYPVANLPFLANFLTIILSLIIASATVISYVKFRQPELAFASFIIIGIIINPASIDYHYLMILIPIIILFKHLIYNSSTYGWAIFAISLFLVSLSIPYISPKITKGMLAVFAYPKLYGALGLLLFSLKLSKLKEAVQ